MNLRKKSVKIINKIIQKKVNLILTILMNKVNSIVIKANMNKFQNL